MFYNCSSTGATEPVAVIKRISTILPQLVCTGKKYDRKSIASELWLSQKVTING